MTYKTNLKTKLKCFQYIEFNLKANFKKCMIMQAVVSSDWSEILAKRTVISEAQSPCHHSSVGTY